MAGKWEPQLEPEPLAFPVKPRRGEAFDSWMDRLTTEHEVTRAQLFDHLKCNPKLASQDLARGWLAFLGSPDLGDFSQLVDGLAEAVEVPRRSIEATFIAAPRDALLPPAMRKFACAECWRRCLIAQEPLIIKREWILRASWKCAEHHLPLAPLLGHIDDRNPRAAQQQLEAQVAATQKLRRRFAISWGMQHRNEALLKGLLGKPQEFFLRGERCYQDRLMANRLHLARSRIALLLAVHSDRDHLVERLETFIDLTVPGLWKVGKGILNPKSRNTATRPARSPEVLEVVRRARWQVTLPELLMAYGSVIARRGAGTEARTSSAMLQKE
jgi:hypothetical protein